VLKQHSIHHRHRLLPVSVILDEGGPWSKDKVLRVDQGILGPLVPRFSVRVKVVDEINDGRCQWAILLNIKQVRAMCLNHESQRIG